MTHDLASILNRVRAAGPGGLLVDAESGALLHGFVTPDEVAFLGARVVVSSEGESGDKVVRMAPELTADSEKLLRDMGVGNLAPGEFMIADGRPLVSAGYIAVEFGLYTITPAGRARLEVL